MSTTSFDNINENIKENYNDGFLISHEAAFPIFITISILAFFPLSSSACFYCSNTRSKKSITLFISAAFAFIGSIILSVYSKNMKTFDKYDYKGPMRLTSLSYYQEQETEGFHTNSYIVPYVGVDWGSTWACPQKPLTHHCSTEVTYTPCKKRICKRNRSGGRGRTTSIINCDKNEVSSAQSISVSCMKEHIGNLDFSVFRTKHQLKTHVPPSMDANGWPTEIFYGDCDSCDSRYSIPSVDKNKKMKDAAFAMWIVSVSLVSLVVLCVFCEKKWQLSSTGKNDHSKKEENPTQMTEKNGDPAWCFDGDDEEN